MRTPQVGMMFRSRLAGDGQPGKSSDALVGALHPGVIDRLPSASRGRDGFRCHVERGLVWMVENELVLTIVGEHRPAALHVGGNLKVPLLLELVVEGTLAA